LAGAAGQGCGEVADECVAGSRGVLGISQLLLQEAASDLEDLLCCSRGAYSMAVGILVVTREMGTPDDTIEVVAFRGYR
jgi:hypothetical protein